jgi:hypothetical protein
LKLCLRSKGAFIYPNPSGEDDEVVWEGQNMEDSKISVGLYTHVISQVTLNGIVGVSSARILRIP